MTTPGRNLAGGAAVAVVVTIVLFNPTIASISTWKWVLGLVGLFLWFLAERTKRRT